LLCSGIGDPATLRYVAELLGHERVEQRSEHRGRDRSSTTGEHLEPLAPPHRVGKPHPTPHSLSTGVSPLGGSG
jgi:hypothetical protein